MIRGGKRLGPIHSPDKQVNKLLQERFGGIPWGERPKKPKYKRKGKK